MQVASIQSIPYWAANLALCRHHKDWLDTQKGKTLAELIPIIDELDLDLDYYKNPYKTNQTKEK